MFIYLIQYNNLFLIITLFITFFNFSALHSQDLKEAVILDEVELISKMSYDSKEYYYYKKKILNVYHYLDTIENIILELDSQLLFATKKREKKKVIKNYKKELIERFINDIKSLTRKEGVILSKLVYRKFGFSVYDILQKYKGVWSAFWWQNLAILYDGDIKSKFYPKRNKEDFLIEKIVKDL